MPTLKKRLNITLSKEMALFLQKVSVRDGVPQATKASELLEKVMEIEEDEYFSTVADTRAKDTKAGTMSHDEFWSKTL